MNAAHPRQHRRASDMTAVDIAAIVVALVSMAVAGVAAARVSWQLMWVAAAIALPATVAKVLSTRAKARWEAEAQSSDRDRRAPDALRRRAESSAPVVS